MGCFKESRSELKSAEPFYVYVPDVFLHTLTLAFCTHNVASRTWKNVNFPGSLSRFPVGRKLKATVPLWRHKNKLFSWKCCT